MNGLVRATKKMMDVTISATCLTCGAPLIFSIAAAVKLTSKGPALYKQRRAGMIPAEGQALPREFWVYKFRTMITDAEKATGPVLATEKDPRVTRVGSVLRKTRLDELPQLFNVLKGDMSLIGPRPERPELLKALSAAIPFFEERMRFIKPGITGLAQVNLSYTGRLPKGSELALLSRTFLNPYDLPETENCTADDMRTKLLYDMAYAASLERFGRFLLTDLQILAKTPFVMFLRRTGI